MSETSHVVPGGGPIPIPEKHGGPQETCARPYCRSARAQNPEIDRNEGSGRWHPIGGKYAGLEAPVHGGSIEACDDTRCKVWVRTKREAGMAEGMQSCDDPDCRHTDCAKVRASAPFVPFGPDDPLVRAAVAGVGPDAPTETNATGHSQSKVQYHFDSIDPRTLLALARVHAEGDAKYGRDNWRGIDAVDHINHAIIHLVAHLAGDRSDDHLAHALCRVGMAHATFTGSP